MGVQESSKSAATVKGIQQVKKSHLTQGKASSPGSPSCRKEQTEESSRTKEGKNRISRVKMESLSRDDHSHILAKSEESAHKLKEDKSKISRVRPENFNPNESVSSPLAVVSDSSNFLEVKTNTLTEEIQSLAPSQLCQTGEEGDVTGLLHVKSEKTNDSERSVLSSLEVKVHVKSEESGTTGIKTEVESSERAILHGQEKIVDGDENEGRVKVMDDEISRPEAGIQRSDYCAATPIVEETEDRRVPEKNTDAAIVDEKKRKALDGEDKLESSKKSTDLVDEMELTRENKLEDIKDLETESEITNINVLTSDVSKERTVDLPATRDVDESEEKLLSSEKAGATDMASVNEKSFQEQLLSDERGHLSLQKDDIVRSEVGSNKVELESMERDHDHAGHTSSSDEHSDVESDISEVSSVHTSDLSSFDDEVSSSSVSSDEQDGEAGKTEANEEPKSEVQDKSNTQSQTENASDAAPMRRSTRISSRRSTKEGESEQSGGEGGKATKAEYHRQRRHGEKRQRKTHSKTSKERSDYSTVKRRRGRPRKEEAHTSSHSTNQRRRSRIRDPDESSSAAGRRGSVAEDRSKRSQRQIKRTRCYSPSSEGTREVFLPRKRSRDGNS